MTDFAQVFSSVMGLVVLTTGMVTFAALALRGVPWADSWTSSVRGSAVWLVCGITWGAMIGSLYFSEVANYAPCKLCWYQRIAMYSMAVISLVAALRRDHGVWRYTIVLSCLGLLISTYHYLVEWYPSLESDVCGVDVPCTTVWFREFGFVTLSFIAGAAFIAVASMSVVLMGRTADS